VPIFRSIRVNLLVFSLLCFVTAFVWDVAYGLVCDRLGHTLDPLMPYGLALFGLFGIPMALCVLAGIATGQWRTERPAFLKAGAAVWCIVTPVVVLFPFFSVMCLAFKSCFGD
jgi:hypothetical protein